MKTMISSCNLPQRVKIISSSAGFDARYAIVDAAY
jgi:hypothetical protein